MTTEDFLLAFLVAFGVKGQGEEGGGKEEGEGGRGGRGVRKSKGNLDNNEIKNNTDNL